MLLKTERDANRASLAIVAYSECKSRVVDAGFDCEIDWQASKSIKDLSESDFLREYAWVVLSCGLSEKCVRKCFDKISAAFSYWESASVIAGNREACKSRALKVFRHELKISAIIEVACKIVSTTFPAIRLEIEKKGVSALEHWPFIGPATSRHLGKNIGLNVAKPDRHLIRIADCLGYDSVDRMCKEISEISGESIAVIDLVFWRYATIDRSYLRFINSPFAQEFCLRVA